MVDVMDIFLKVKNYNSTSKKSKRKNDFEFLNKINIYNHIFLNFIFLLMTESILKFVSGLLSSGTKSLVL